MRVELTEVKVSSRRWRKKVVQKQTELEKGEQVKRQVAVGYFAFYKWFPAYIYVVWIIKKTGVCI